MNSELLHIFKHLPDILPPTLLGICEKFIRSYPDITEIRLRRNSNIVFTLGDGSIESGFICDGRTFDDCLRVINASDHYKRADDLVNGVIPLPHGFRVGVGGTALIDHGRMTNVYNVSTLNIRLPRAFKGVSMPLYEYLAALPFLQRSFLILAPPCSGKTTVLRDIARILSTPPVAERVCVVDTKMELVAFGDKPPLHMDVFSGYPTPCGIEIATRYFNPRYIICDEIGRAEELDAIKSASHSGVPLIASSHSSSLSDALFNPVLRSLLAEKVFCNVVELRMRENTILFTFIPRKEIERLLCTQNLSLL